jgi:hypothetical protein
MSATGFHFQTLSRHVFAPAIALLLLAPGCGESSGSPSSDEETSADGSSGSGESGATSNTESGTSNSDSATTNDDSATTNDDSSTTGDETTATAGFVNTDMQIDSMCSPTLQDCPEGQKCTAYSTDGAGPPSAPWDANKCVDETGDLEIGDPCDIEGGKYTGIDDCKSGSQCLMTDDEGFGGVCVEFCDDNMGCGQPTAQCNVVNNGALPLCLDSCDPLVQDCPDGQGCFAAAGSFVCFKYSAEAGEGMVGGDCGFINSCLPGNMCLAVEASQDCPATNAGCCAPFCAISDGGAECNTQEQCLLVLDPAPPGFEDVGVCSIPV